MQVGAGRGEVRVPQLALDQRQRDALAQQLDDRNAGAHRLTVVSDEAARGGRVRAGWPVVGSVLVGWWLVGERDLEVDLDSPAAPTENPDRPPAPSVPRLVTYALSRPRSPLPASTTRIPPRPRLTRAGKTVRLSGYPTAPAAHSSSYAPGVRRPFDRF